VARVRRDVGPPQPAARRDAVAVPGDEQFVGLLPGELLRASIERKETTAVTATRWVRYGDAQRAVAWSQYLRPGFGTTDWVVVASQSEGYILSKLIEYQRIYVPVVVLALLLVTWLTIRQSRSIVDPVSQLVVGARAISRSDFSSRVDMNRSDEFGELADAFNRMSEKLGRQFAALTALSEIDQLILSTLDTAQVARIVLERMGDVVPANFIGLTLFDPDNRDLGQTYFRDMQRNDDGVVFARLKVRPEDRALLEANLAGSWIALEADSAGLLLALHERGVRTAYVQPIVWRQEVCGANKFPERGLGILRLGIRLGVGDGGLLPGRCARIRRRSDAAHGQPPFASSGATFTVRRHHRREWEKVASFFPVHRDSMIRRTVSPSVAAHVRGRSFLPPPLHVAPSPRGVGARRGGLASGRIVSIRESVSSRG